LLVVDGDFVVRMWFLDALFSASRIFLVFEIYFCGWAIRRLFRSDAAYLLSALSEQSRMAKNTGAGAWPGL
jgi:hypothetical protein